MRIILALMTPSILFFTIGRPITAFICLIMQITIVGWIPASLGAVYGLGQYKTDKKIKKAINQTTLRK